MIMRTESVPWIVIDIQPLPGHRLHVRFIDGTEGDVDLSRMVFSDKAGVFVALRDPARFAEARVTDGVVTWPGDLDLAGRDVRRDQHARTLGHRALIPPPPR